MQNLREYISPKTRALVWINDEDLTTNTKHFDEVNYLLDGLLARLDQGPTSLKSPHFFQGQSFGKPFSIAYLLKSDEFDKNLNQVKEQLKHLSSNDEVVIFNQTKVSKKFNFGDSIIKEISL